MRRRGRSASPPTDREAADKPPLKKKKEDVDPVLTRAGGAYIPPAKLRLMQQQITDKSRWVGVAVYSDSKENEETSLTSYITHFFFTKCSLAYQRMSWEALKKSINGLINKVNVSNLVNIIQELLQENIVRGR